MSVLCGQVQEVLEWDGFSEPVGGYSAMLDATARAFEQDNLTNDVRAAVLQRRADAFHALDQYPSEIVNLRTAVKLQPENPELLWRLARVLLASPGSKDEGAQLAIALAARRRDFAPAQYVLGMHYSLEGKEDLAIEQLVRALRADSTFTLAWGAVVSIHFNKGEYEEALWYSEGALLAPPINVCRRIDIHLQRGYSFLFQDNLQQAEASLLHAIRLQRETSQVDSKAFLTLKALWECYEAQGDFGGCLIASRARMKLPNPEPDVLNLHGLTLAWAGRPAEGMKHCQRVAELEGTANDWAIGVCYAEMGEYKNALERFNAAVNARDVRSTTAKLLKIYLLATCPREEVRDGKMALQLINRLLTRDERQPLLRKFLILKSMAEAECGNFEDALKALELMRTGNPSAYEIETSGQLEGLYRQGHAYRYDPSRPETTIYKCVFVNKFKQRID